MLCLAVGWAFLYASPGVATLRCVRVVRVLWLFDFSGSAEAEPSAVISVSKFCHLTVRQVIRRRFPPNIGAACPQM